MKSQVKVSKLLAAGLVLILLFHTQGTLASDRAFRVGATLVQLTGDDFPSVKSGGGVAGAYEFYVSPNSIVGINSEVRFYSGDPSLTQLGYGLLLKHPLSPSEWGKPYLEYGLLMNVTRVSGTSGAGMSHDTRLAVGTDFHWNEKLWFADVAYHISHLTALGQSSMQDLNYLQISFGLRWEWTRHP